MEEVVVPPGDEVCGRVDLAVAVPQAVAAPVLVVGVVLYRVAVEGYVYDVVQGRNEGETAV